MIHPQPDYRKMMRFYLISVIVSNIVGIAIGIGLAQLW